MATLNVTEYQNMAPAETGHRIPVGKEPAEARTNVTFTSSSALQLGADTRFVRVIADADCYLAFAATSPTATANDSRMKANVVEFFGVDPNSYVAVYDGTT